MKQFGLVIVLLTGCSLLLSCEEKIKPSVASAAAGKDLPSQESWNATITFTDSGRISGILHAGYIAGYDDKQTTLLDSNITVDFYDELGKHTSVLTARKGHVDDVSHNLVAEGNVLVVSDSGTVLKTEILYWNNETQRVSSEEYVEITSPTEQIQGHGFESDRALLHYHILRVTGQATKLE